MCIRDSMNTAISLSHCVAPSLLYSVCALTTDDVTRDSFNTYDSPRGKIKEQWDAFGKTF